MLDTKELSSMIMSWTQTQTVGIIIVVQRHDFTKEFDLVSFDVAFY